MLVLENHSDIRVVFQAEPAGTQHFLAPGETIRLEMRPPEYHCDSYLFVSEDTVILYEQCYIVSLTHNGRTEFPYANDDDLPPVTDFELGIEYKPESKKILDVYFSKDAAVQQGELIQIPAEGDTTLFIRKVNES